MLYEDLVKEAFLDELRKIAAANDGQLPSLSALCTKLAFGEGAMSQVLRKVKSMQIRPKEILEGVPAGYNAVSPRLLRASESATLKILSDAGLPASMADEALAPLRSLSARGSRIVVPTHGDATRFFRSETGGKPLLDVAYYTTDRAVPLPKSPAHRKALDALVKGHELAETQARPSRNGVFYSHVSPDVILREHNMMTTMPAHLRPAADALRHIRVPLEGTDVYMHTGVNLGKGPRFSRHARKHLTRMIDTGRAEEAAQLSGSMAGAEAALDRRAQAVQELAKLGGIGVDTEKVAVSLGGVGSAVGKVLPASKPGLSAAAGWVKPGVIPGSFARPH